MANFVSSELGIGAPAHYRRMHSVLRKNYSRFERHEIPMAPFLEGLSKDKKNTSAKLGLILPDRSGIPQRVYCEKDDRFISACERFFKQERAVD